VSDSLDTVMGEVKFNPDGLVPAIVQEDTTGEVLMMAWMNQESLRLTVERRRTVFYSRSRQELWAKGDTSGDIQEVRSLHYDCDGDTLLVRVTQHGKGACHTGSRTCFFREIELG
jgi:phosphoribosyl-AMP cyclohydrolase